MAMDINISQETQKVEIRFSGQVITRKIWQDENGRDYFNVPNLLNHPERITNHIFSHRIKDAVDTIRNGDGDVVARLKSFGFENVIRYLDRDYGEKVRELFLEGWKNAKFAYIVLANGFYIDEKGSIDIKPHRFETQEEAEKYISGIYQKMNAVFQEYMHLPKSERNEFFENLFTKSDYTFVEYEYYHYIVEKEFTGSAKFPFKIAQITF